MGSSFPLLTSPFSISMLFATDPPKQNDQWQQFAKNFLLWGVALSLVGGLTLILGFNGFWVQQTSFQIGEQAEADLFAPQTTSYISQVLTEEARQQEADKIPLQYQPINLDLARSQSSQAQALLKFVDVVRADGFADIPTKVGYLQAVAMVTVEPQIAADLLSFTPNEFADVGDDILRIVEETMRQEVQEAALQSYRQSAQRQISFFLTESQERVIMAIAPQLIVPNVFPDEEETDRLRQEQIDKVPEVEVVVKQGERVVSAGTLLEPKDLEKLEKLGLIQPSTSWKEFVTAMIISLLSTTLIISYWRLFGQQLYPSSRYLLILAMLILLFSLGAKLAIPGQTSLAYLFPTAALAMLLAVVFDVRLGVLVTVVMGMLIGYIAGTTVELTIYHIMGSLIAVLTLGDRQRVNAFFRAGLVSSLVNVTVILIFHLPQTQELRQGDLLELSSWAIANGIVSASLTLGGLFLLGSGLGITTFLQLQELSRLDHPLLQELLRRAPGTYHHSIMVANLAEQAAELVRANAVLVRVGAFYHDVGKMQRPPFFTENQAGKSPHDVLDPYESAKIIISHVPDGLEFARQYRLPDHIRDFIAEHHGNNLVASFYHKAVQQANKEETQVDASRFRYPGPRPRSRETGIVLLADSIEAASSAVRPSTETEIEKLVNSIVDAHLKAGQLDDSGLTLGEIKQLRNSFIKTLKGRFHVRVQYPEVGGANVPASTPPTPVEPNRTQQFLQSP